MQEALFDLNANERRISADCPCAVEKIPIFCNNGAPVQTQRFFIAGNEKQHSDLRVFNQVCQCVSATIACRFGEEHVLVVERQDVVTRRMIGGVLL